MKKHAMSAPGETYRHRRAKLAAGIRRPLLILAGKARNRNPANDWPFRAASTYLYYGGPPVEDAAWIIEPGSDGDTGCTLLRPAAGADDAVWFGESAADDALADAAGIDLSRIAPAGDLEQLVSGRDFGSICPECPSTLQRVAAAGLSAATPDELNAIIDMRNIKDQHELAAMRKAARVGIEAHLATMRAAIPGHTEAEAAAEFHSVLVRRQCAPSFTPIVTVHGEVLHCLGYGNRMAAGDLLLVDGGAEESGGYASDITRVSPVGGEFSPIQKQLYDTVHRAEQAAVAHCKVGTRYRDVHDVAARVICEGLVDADLLRGDPNDLFERKAHTLFFAHGVGHLIGLDVHDLEDFGDIAGYPEGRTRRTGFGEKFLRLDRDLLPGMAVTVEPGIYLIPAIWRRDDLVGPLADCINRSAVDALLESNFGGIRLEDTVVVRESGEPENLTADLPIAADEVAAVVRSGA